MIAYIVAMHLVGAVPADVSVATYLAAIRHGVDPVELGSYLVSEHGDDWTDRPDACSSRGACGPFQLVALWPREFGYEAEARADVWASADIAAQVIAYTHGSHADCGTDADHTWRAHLKCSRRSRDSCRGPVRRWLEFERSLREVLDPEGRS